MPDEPTTDLDVEIAVIREYGYALAEVAEHSLRYPDLMRGARSEAERDQIRAEYHKFLKTTINAVVIALSVLDSDGGLKEGKTP